MKLRPNAKIVYFVDKVLLTLQLTGAALHRNNGKILLEHD